MYCGACEIHRGFKDGGKLRMEVAQKHGCLPGDVRCEGCRAVHIIGWSRAEYFGRNCALLACLKSRGLESCGDCDRRSACDRWQELAGHCVDNGIYLEANLKAMRQQGVDTWLEAQKSRWQCQSCGRAVVADTITPRCHRCGSHQL
jgi:hypothetical protein